MAIQFTQDSSDRVAIADNTASDLSSGDWSMGIRFKFSTLTYSGSDPYFFTKDFGGGGARYYFGMSEFGTGYDYPFCGFNDGTNPEVYLEYTPESFSTGVWYTMVVVRSSGTATLYINNVSRATNSGTLGAVQPAGDVWIGNREETPPIDRGFPGDLAEAFICDYALTADDRQAYEDGYSPLFFSQRPTWYYKGIRDDEDEVMTGAAATHTGTAASAHYPGIYPSIRRTYHYPNYYQAVINDGLVYGGSGALNRGWQVVINDGLVFDGSGGLNRTWQVVVNDGLVFDGSGIASKGWYVTINDGLVFDGSAIASKGWYPVINDGLVFGGSGGVSKIWEVVTRETEEQANTWSNVANEVDEESNTWSDVTRET